MLNPVDIAAGIVGGRNLRVPTSRKSATALAVTGSLAIAQMVAKGIAKNREARRVRTTANNRVRQLTASVQEAHRGTVLNLLNLFCLRIGGRGSYGPQWSGPVTTWDSGRPATYVPTDSEGRAHPRTTFTGGEWSGASTPADRYNGNKQDREQARAALFILEVWETWQGLVQQGLAAGVPIEVAQLGSAAMLAYGEMA
jgi:hypothetical protein